MRYAATGEQQRPAGQAVNRHFRAVGVRVFYEENERAQLWGKDMAEDLQQIYFVKSEYVLMFIFKDSGEDMDGHEKRAALAAAISANREYILPVRSPR